MPSHFALKKFCFVILGVAMSLTSLEARARLRDPIPLEEIQERLALLQHSPWDGTFKQVALNSNMRCKFSRVEIPVTDPISGETTPVSLALVQPRDLTQTPVIVVVPTIKGTTLVEYAAAGQLCYSNLAAIIADVTDNSQPEEMPAWGHEDRTNRDTILSLRTVIDFAEAFPEFDNSNIGMMGFSLGGISTSFMAGVEADRLKAVVMTVAGGNFPHALATSTNSEISLLRQRRMAHEKMSDVIEYEEKLHETVKLDPIYFAHLARTDRIFMIMGAKDTSVPYAVQRQLYDAFGQPEFFLLNRAHKGTILEVVGFHMKKIAAFFKSKFDLPGEAPQQRWAVQ